MKCISFVGIGHLYPTRYRYGDQIIETHVVQEAICNFFGVEEVILVTTKKAYETNYSEIISRLNKYKMVEIPNGSSEEELWQIFNIISENVGEGDEIIFDITHSFRSLPFITFLSAAYLSTVKNVRIAKIVYGAYEARGDDGLTPIFDLTPFLSLLDWMSGVQAFLNHVDAKPICKIISEIQRTAHTEESVADPPTSLTNWGNALNDFTSSVRLARPIDVHSSAGRIFRDMDSVRTELTRFAPPMEHIMADIYDLKQFFFQFEDEPTFSTEMAEIQRRLIRYQVEKRLYLQAAETAREFMVSTLLLKFGDEQNWLKKDYRLNAENTYGGAVMKMRGNNFKPTVYSSRFHNIRGWEEISKKWDKVAQLRNELAHCGMNTNPPTLGNIEGRAKELPDLIDKFCVLVNEAD